jgi:hypothetical protein
MADTRKHPLRYFLPLTSEAFCWYDLTKDVEVRKFSARFKGLLDGKYQFIELRKGYSGQSKFARIEKVLTYENSKELFDDVDYTRVVPETSRETAENLIYGYAGNGKIIAIFLARPFLKSL